MHRTSNQRNENGKDTKKYITYIFYKKSLKFQKIHFRRSMKYIRRMSVTN